MDLKIDITDLKALYIACKMPDSFEAFVNQCERGYKDYHARNTAQPEKYGQPKTYSQWINAQTIALT